LAEKKERSNKLAEWDTSEPTFEEKLKEYLPNVNYSFTLNGIRVGFTTMEVDVKSNILQMNTVLLSYPTQETEQSEVIQHFVVYGKVLLYGSTLIYPS
jgi:hypothetical protein